MENMKLLKTLYATWSGSGKEKAMREFIKTWISKNASDAKVTEDRYGNVYVVRGEAETYPCIVAHTDQVQHKYPQDYMVLSSGLVISAIDAKTRELCGLGADDKNGIWVALTCLEKYQVMKCAFFVEEERGAIGSSKCDMTFFDDVRWVAECDRKGHQDFVTSISGTDLSSKTFQKDACLPSHKYDTSPGGLTDVYELKRRGLKVSCCNMSCGYYESHSSREYTVVPDLEKCLRLVQHMVEKMTDVYRHEYKPAAHPVRRDFGYSRSVFGAYGRMGWSEEVDVEALTERVTNYLEANRTQIDHKNRTKDDDRKLIDRLYDKFGYMFWHVCTRERLREIMTEVFTEWAAEEEDQPSDSPIPFDPSLALAQGQ